MSSPRTIIIPKSDDGYGFNIRGQVIEGGQVKAIHGKLYAPLQQISAISSQSLAEQAGLQIGERILQVNGIDVEGASHQQVVDLIKNCQGELRLVVLPPTASDEKITDIRSVESPPSPPTTATTASSSKTSHDYSEQRSLAIAIPDYKTLEINGEKFQTFNINIAGRHLCSRRYREFDILNQQLKERFPDFSFPSLPAKWPFKLSDQQLDARRRGLEQYLDKICSVCVIANSDVLGEFLSFDTYDRYALSTDIDLKIVLPDRSTKDFKVNRFAPVERIYEIVADKLGLPRDCRPYFYLFEIIDNTFERKLRPSEFPYQIVAENNETSLSLCKFIFSPSIENDLLKYPLACDYIYHQAIKQMKHHSQTISNKSDKIQFIQHAQTLTDIYNTTNFPPCSCSSRKDNGHVITSINAKRLRLSACDERGQIDTNHIANFDWSIIEKFYVKDDDLVFEYKRSTMKYAKAVKLETFYAQFMYDCFDCIFRELQLNKQNS